MKVTLNKLYSHTGIRLALLHPSSGIAQQCNAPPLMHTPSSGVLHITPNRVLRKAPHVKGRNTKKLGPITALATSHLPLTPAIWHDYAYRPGMRAKDLYPNQIRTIPIPNRNQDQPEQWLAEVKTLIDPLLLETTLVVLASPPANARRQKGVVQTILFTPGSPPQAQTIKLQMSNHHELTLAGIVHATPSLLTTTGHVNLLIRNQAALSTLFPKKNGPNSHYGHTFNSLALPWLQNQSNFLHLGWIPAQYVPNHLKHLFLNLGKLRPSAPHPATVTAPTAWRLIKEEQITLSAQTLSVKRGAHWPDLGSAKRNHKLRFITAAQNKNNLLSCLTYALTCHAPIGRYYLTRPWFQRHSGCKCDLTTHQTRRHLLDVCPLYIRHWESWLDIPHNKEQPLHGLVAFLLDNPKAFSFEHAPEKTFFL
ncbi:hypothetical protein AX15_006190 [Amanita polypyramis BW_CC]|nr:hypothetical protein AX15_006190 [Amanita polypyramis BW_CC]